MSATAKPSKGRKTTGYQWKPGKRFGVPAAVAGASLESIRRANAGSLTPAAVVDAARDPTHPLHPAFCWDDTEAAERWREQQARVLINSVRVVVTRSDGQSVRVAFVSVVNPLGERGYQPSSVVMGTPDLRAQALADALAALDGWRCRYSHLEELAEVFAAIDKVKAKRKAV